MDDLKRRISDLCNELSRASRESYALEDENESEAREGLTELENKVGGAILRFLRGKA